MNQSMKEKNPAAQAQKTNRRWLVLVHQLPPKPAYLRVKVWRRLQGLGAIAVKNSVYVLPAVEQAREDFQWLLQEIRRDGGDGMVCEAEIVDGMRDDEVRQLFDSARDQDYAELAKEARTLKRARKGKARDRTLKPQLEKLKQRFDVAAARDHFGSSGRLIVEAAITELENSLAEDAPGRDEKREPLRGLVGRTWVTRKGVQVDRIASAWLIKRFIDPKAVFKFVDEKSHRHTTGELRFDMFRGEYTHVGDRCTFEVVTQLLPGKDPALRAIGEIVHDIDLKDQKYGRDETAGLAHVMAGICDSHDDDLVRIARGSAVLDDTYGRFRKKRANH